MRPIAVALGVVVSLVAAGCGASKTAAPDTTTTTIDPFSLHGAVPTPTTAAPEFTLKDAQGRAYGLTQPPGHWLYVTFLYTKCPDVCPIIAGNLNQVLRSKTAKDAGLEVVAVSTDPKNDTAAAVRKYERAHGLVPRFHYLIGTRKELEAVWRKYHVAVLPRSGGIGHTAWEILVDPSGQQRLIYPSNTLPAGFIADLKKLTT